MSYNRHLTIVTGESLYPRIIILMGSHCSLGYSDRDSFCTRVTQSYDNGATCIIITSFYAVSCSIALRYHLALAHDHMIWRKLA